MRSDCVTKAFSNRPWLRRETSPTSASATTTAVAPAEVHSAQEVQTAAVQAVLALSESDLNANGFANWLRMNSAELRPDE